MIQVNQLMRRRPIAPFIFDILSPVRRIGPRQILRELRHGNRRIGVSAMRHHGAAGCDVLRQLWDEFRW
ncbi:MAG: hypothetical protein KA226_11715 [Gemmatimonadales bacterium]|nr:hypothetical protein [Gemmatimonadales bacterium]